MGKVVAIGTSILPLDLQVACYGILSRHIQKGHQVDIIVARGKEGDKQESLASEHPPEKIADLIAKSYKGMGISSLHFVDEFDYSTVSQTNVDALRLPIEAINPEYAIIPFYKSNNKDLEILGRSALLACRWIRNVLMYETAVSSDSRFQPGIFAALSHAEYDKKKATIADLKENGNYKLIGDALKKMDALHSSNFDKINGGAPLESLQSHRLLLLSAEQDGLFQ